MRRSKNRAPQRRALVGHEVRVRRPAPGSRRTGSASPWNPLACPPTWSGSPSTLLASLDRRSSCGGSLPSRPRLAVRGQGDVAAAVRTFAEATRGSGRPTVGGRGRGGRPPRPLSRAAAAAARPACTRRDPGSARRPSAGARSDGPRSHHPPRRGCALAGRTRQAGRRHHRQRRRRLNAAGRAAHTRATVGRTRRRIARSPTGRTDGGPGVTDGRAERRRVAPALASS